MLPSLTSAIDTISQRIYFKQVSKSIVDYENSEAVSSMQWCPGSIQPMPAEELLVKPEGQRSWKYWRLFTQQTLLQDNELIDSNNRRYRVMATEDWTQAGFKIYQLSEGPTP